MKKYFLTFMNRLMTTIVYRFDFVCGLALTAFNVMISVFVWNAIYKTSTIDSFRGYSFEDMVVYLVLTNISSMVFSFDICFRIGNMIRTGQFSTYLFRPINVLYDSFFDYLGRCFISILIFIGTVFIYDLYSGIGIFDFLLTLSYFFLCIFLWFQIASIISLLGFRVIQMWPLKPILRGVYMLFAGMYFPISFLPSGFSRIIAYNPFGMIGCNLSEVVMGKYIQSKVFTLNIYLVLCIIILNLIYRVLYKKALKLYEGMGA